MMQDFDKLWNFSDPAGTEKLFQKALEDAMEKDVCYKLELLTQIARTYSLRGLTDTAHEILDKAEKQLPEEIGVAHIRYHLERGRAFNTAGKKAEAGIHFLQAKDFAADLKQDFYTVDALHMLAITATGPDAIRFNEEAIAFTMNSTDEACKKWLGSLLNNLGWNYFDAENYEEALSLFLHALDWREGMKESKAIFLAKWCVGRTLRAMNRFEEAIKIQLGLMEEMLEKEHPDGYVYEELGELYLSKQEKLSKMYFGLAWQELGKDEYLRKNEPTRLGRIRDLAQ